MYYASISEAFGVDDLEKKEDPKMEPKVTKKVERVRFPAELLGEEDDDITMIPDDRKLSDLEVKQYISDMYTKKGISRVWNLLDSRIKKKVVESCKKSVRDTKKWFDDIITSPEKLLVILALLFVLILLLDSSSAKPQDPVTYRPTDQYYYYPQQQFSTPELRW
jgi:hypothetical protein